MLFSGIVIAVVTLVWQCIAIKLDKSGHNYIRPTTMLDFITAKVKYVCFHIGKFIAYISSFYEYLALGEIFDALCELTNSTWNLLTSGFQIIRGYISVSHLYEHPYLVTCGSITIVAALAYGIHIYEIVDFQSYIELPLECRAM